MRRALGISGVLLALTLSAAAYPQPYSCDQIRWAAQTYGVNALIYYARQQGYSERQIRQAKLCLRTK